MSRRSDTTEQQARRWWTGEHKVALMAIGVAVFVVVLAPNLDRVAIPDDSVRIPWWVFVVLVAVAESAVVHFRFRRDSYSFSMSEIPLVLGLFFATPVGFLTGHFLGNIAAFWRRGNRGVKLALNVVGSSAEAVVAIGVFRVFAGFGDPFGPWGWLGVGLASMSALLVSDFLVTQAIRLTGGRLSRRELNDVLIFSLAASSMNAGLGLIAALLVHENRASAWLAVLPPATLMIAYRAYTTQSDERARAESLYQGVLALHRAPVIDDALDVVTEQVLSMFESRVCVAMIIPDWGGRFVYQTVALDGRVKSRMRPAVFDAGGEPWSKALSNPDGIIYTGDEARSLRIPEVRDVHQAMVTPVRNGERLVGVLLVANPNGLITNYGERDLQTFATIARHLATSLENGRLEDSLAEVTRLKERLEELVRSKDQFIASVSHELRTPLTGIIGLTQELRSVGSQFGPDETSEFLEMIHEQSLELGNIIEDLLVAARADLGTLAVKPAVTSLEGELDAVLATHAPKAAGKQLSTTVRGTGSAVVDPLRFRQIMRNLVTNAIRYGGQNIWVEVEVVDGLAVVAVVDDGKGVPSHAVEEIFEPYTRAGTTASSSSSVGLGLAVSRQLARLMGGELSYRRDGGTTRFELRLPSVEESVSLAG